jgi:hypothetical protein
MTRSSREWLVEQRDLRSCTSAAAIFALAHAALSGPDSAIGGVVDPRWMAAAVPPPHREPTAASH